MDDFDVIDFFGGMHPPQSYSRKLDERVARQEKPYGYEGSPPPADTGDFDQARLESSKKYSVRGGKVR